MHHIFLQAGYKLESWKQLSLFLFDCLFYLPSVSMVIAYMKLKDAYSLEGKLWPT